MKLLLDTHAFLWWAAAPDKLSERVLLACQDRDNKLILSVASVWEMQIKLQLGKLKLQPSLNILVEAQQRANDLQILPIELGHVLALSDLPPHHKDPFDRILVAQALAEDAYLVSADEALARYPASLFW
jgi:PIN domain nuclease of toxin-antitoxin system